MPRPPKRRLPKRWWVSQLALWLACVYCGPASGCSGRSVLAIDDGGAQDPMRCSPGVDVGCICAPAPPGEWLLREDIQQFPTHIEVADNGDLLELHSSSGFFQIRRRSPDRAEVWARGWLLQSRIIGPLFTVDPLGDVYVFGTIAGRSNLGAGFVGSDDQPQLFLLKLSGADGALLWSVSFPDTVGDPNRAVATALVASEEGVYLAGEYHRFRAGEVPSLRLGGPELPNLQRAIFLARLSPEDGSHIWSRGYSTGAAFPKPRIAVGAGRVYVTGRVERPVSTEGSRPDLGRGELMLEASTGAEFFIAAYETSTGAHLFSSHHGGASDDRGEAIVADDSGFALVARVVGQFQVGGFDIDTGTSGNNQDRVLVARFDPDGQPIYARLLEREGQTRSYDLALRADGGLYVRGFAFANEAAPIVDLGGGPLPVTAEPFFSTQFVVRLDPAGGWLWNRVVTQETLGGSLSGNEVAYSPCADVLYELGSIGASIPLNFGDGFIPGPGYYLRRIAP